jgi:hypothetical protein
MHDSAQTHDEPFSPPEDMVSASELREFLFCKRAWFLSKNGFQVSKQAVSQRTAGIVFHESRAAAASKGRSQWVFWGAVILAVAGIALLIFEACG